jgi:sugar-specific transcriptional regulator TrmB
MNTNLLNWLISTGLDEQRAKIYLACLSKGSASASEIAESMKMNRTAVYDNLKHLEEKGYIHVVHEGKQKLYTPLHPKELYKQFDSKRQQLKDLLPDFLAVYADTATEPFVQLFQGQYAAREVMEDILATARDEYVYLSAPRRALQTYDRQWIEEWVERRVKKGIRSRSLRVQNEQVKELTVFSEEAAYLRQIRYMPEYVDLKSSIYIYEDNVGVISTKQEDAAAIIHSADLAYSFKQIFEFLWGISRKS